MDIRQGIVTRTITAKKRNGDEFIASIDLDGYRLKLAHTVHKPFEISVGDKLAVWGRLKQGIFHAHAFRNFSNGLTSAIQVRAMLAVSLVGLALSCTLLTISSFWLFKSLGLLLGVGAIYSAYMWQYTSKGLRKLLQLPT